MSFAVVAALARFRLNPDFRELGVPPELGLILCVVVALAGFRLKPDFRELGAPLGLGLVLFRRRGARRVQLEP